MRKRPLSVIVIAWLYIATGAVGLAVHVANRALESDIILIAIVEVLAVIAGAFLLRGSNWARWLAIAWIAFHVILSAFHAWSELLVHAVLCAAFAYLLFRPQTNEYFRCAPGSE